jgi:maltooligosyltrehalose trehalohydrolase
MATEQEAGLGAVYQGNGVCRFVVWAPQVHRVEVHLLSPRDQLVPMQPRPHGYHEGVLHGVPPGSLYTYRLDGHRDRPDPASRLQPRGVHGPSQVVDPYFEWHDHGWVGPTLADLVIYELHAGTFTPQGTLDAVSDYLDDLRDLGITAIELMPLAQCPGRRNWGYDGVYPFAVQNNYGGPEGLKRLVDACHQKGLAVLLDVVYNHLGPEGNYLGEFAPYFTDQYRIPWGTPLNFDGRHSDEVRRFFAANALRWLDEFHIDGLRLDAIDYIKDFTARPFLEELAELLHAEAARLGRRFHLVGESKRNDIKVIRPPERGGLGMDAQWSDDFHHALHALLTEERQGYYQDFGQLDHLARAFRDGFVYAGEYSAYRGRRQGVSSRGEPGCRFVVYSQNHDQVGNRLSAERLSQLVPFEALKLAAGLVLLSPFVPLLFMGEEYGETAPFPFFIEHGNPDLVEAIRRGRREKCGGSQWQGEMPDPQDERTFQRARLRHELKHQGQHRTLRAFYKQLLEQRKGLAPLAQLSKDQQEVIGFNREQMLVVRRWHEGEEVLLVANLGIYPTTVRFAAPRGEWVKLLDSAEPRWHGDGPVLPERSECGGQMTLTSAARSLGVYQLARPL